MEPHKILDTGYKNLLANTDSGFNAEWFPEEKDKFDVNTLRPKPTLGSKLSQFWTGF